MKQRIPAAGAVVSSFFLAAVFGLSAAALAADGPELTVKPLTPPVPGGDLMTLDFTFAPNISSELKDVTLTLRCVEVDADSGSDCNPGSGNCADPKRSNNPACERIEVLNSPMRIRSVPVGTEIASQFRIRVDQENLDQVTVEFMLAAQAPGAGAGISAAVSRLTLGSSDVTVRPTARTDTAGAAAAAVATGAAVAAAGDPKDSRIEEYLRRKEERRARRALEDEQLAQAQAEEARVAEETGMVEPGTPDSDAAVAVAAGAAALTAAALVDDPEPVVEDFPVEEGEIVLPRQMAEMQVHLRRTHLADDPTVQTYLDLIDRAEASPYQLAAFGNFLAQNGMLQVALIYYDVALNTLEEPDALLLMNLGILYHKLGRFDQAVNELMRALALDPTIAFAHYNLGATYDKMGKYEKAVDEYKFALTLDPSLGDPATNPQAASNDRLLAVKLMIYQEQIGNRGLPLVDVPDGGVNVTIEKIEPESN